jgi:hypothetical protein
LNCVKRVDEIIQLMKLLNTKSMIRYLPPNGTAGLARSRVVDRAACLAAG